MSIASAITAAQGKVADAYTAISNKGGTLPATQDLSNMPTAINSIPSGGGDTVTAINNTGSAISEGDKVWLEKVSGAWNVVSFYGDLENFNRIGSPTITNKVVSGFSSSNYLRLLQGFNPENNTWEVGGLRFNIQTPNIWQGLFGSNVSNSNFGIILHFDSSNKFLLSLSTNGSSWVHIFGSVAQINTDYWVKFGWTGTEYYLDISTDGSTYTRDASESISSPIVSNLTQTYIGANMEIGGVGNPFGGSINLSEMYIKIGNSIWWTPYYTNILTDALTGTAAENIAVGGTGDVEIGGVVGGSKYGATIDNILGDIDSNGVLQAPTGEMNLVFSGAEDLAEFALAYAFYSALSDFHKKVKTVSFPDLISVSGNQSLYDAFHRSEVTTASFPELTTISGTSALNASFQNCTSLASVSFPKLTTISGVSGMAETFTGCTALTSVSFPELTTISGANGMYRIFSNCSNIVTASFPKLATLSGNNAMNGALRGCTSLTDVYFNALTTTSFGSYVSQFNNLMQSTGSNTTHTLHFPSNLQSTISGLTGYPLFGGTSGYVTLAFDLPATS